LFQLSGAGARRAADADGSARWWFRPWHDRWGGKERIARGWVVDREGAGETEKHFFFEKKKQKTFAKLELLHT
jgi:hypothetical protein